MSDPKTEPKLTDAATHAIKSYLGGKYAPGHIPFGPRLISDDMRGAIVAEIVEAGLSATFEPADTEKGTLAVLVISDNGKT